MNTDKHRYYFREFPITNFFKKFLITPEALPQPLGQIIIFSSSVSIGVYLWLILILYFTLNFPIYSQSENSLLGEWFSGMEQLETGFNFHQITISKNSDEKLKFYLNKISFNQSKKWEEAKYTGTIQKKSNSNKCLLNVESCKEYASKKLVRRWALFRHYDCNHIQLTLDFQHENKFTITPNMDLESSIAFKKINPSGKNNLSCVIIDSAKDLEWCWGHQLYRRLSKKAKIINFEDKIELNDIMESVVKLKSNRIFKIGDLIIFDSPPEQFNP